MSNDTTTGDTERYSSWKSEIRAELEAYEGHGPPSAEELWHLAEYEASGVVSWISDMPVSEQEIQTAKGDVLKALVALEMAEERLNGGDS